MARWPERSTLDRFLAKIKVNDAGCWLWTAYCNPAGYGRLYSDGRQVMAHRWAFEHFVGPVPNGLDLDHFHCEVRRCVNPQHVRPATRRENTLRGDTIPAMNLAKTHCIKGHAFDRANTRIEPGGARVCRACVRDAVNRYRRKRALR